MWRPLSSLPGPPADRRSSAARRVLFGGAAALLTLIPRVSNAETLLDAINLAYQTSPVLHAQQAQLRATDESLVQAHAAYGPQASLSLNYAYDVSKIDQPASIFSPATTTTYRSGTRTGNLSLNQPLYTFGATHAQVEGAEANVAGGRQTLRQAEAQLLLNVITAYEDVRRDRASLTIVRSELEALNREFAETKARSEIGDLTKTDRAQSEARLLQTKGQLAILAGQMNTSIAEYVDVVGEVPDDLAPPPDLPGIPANVDLAFDVADHNNPQLLAALDAVKVADAQVKQAKAAFGPTVGIQVTAGVSPVATYIPNQYDRGVTVAAVVSQPLFTSGINSSKVREALDLVEKAQFELTDTRRGVVRQVANAWDQLMSIRMAIVMQQRQVELETIAVEGNRVEEKVGLRTTIDLLNAELELASSKITLLQSQHDEYVAGVAVLAAVGRLEARAILPGGPIYDPKAAADKVKNKLAPPWVPAVSALDGISPKPGTPPAGAQLARPTPRPSVSGSTVVGDPP